MGFLSENLHFFPQQANRSESLTLIQLPVSVLNEWTRVMRIKQILSPHLKWQWTQFLWHIKPEGNFKSVKLAFDWNGNFMNEKCELIIITNLNNLAPRFFRCNESKLDSTKKKFHSKICLIDAWDANDHLRFFIIKKMQFGRFFLNGKANEILTSRKAHHFT